MLALCGGAVHAQPVLRAVGIESQYADVMAQIGGQYVQVSAIETDPNTDPHEFEISPKVARSLAKADVVVENGLGYDAWADPMLKTSGAQIINAQRVLALPDATPNPHLWYSPKTMAALAPVIAQAFAARDAAHAAYYQKNEKTFIASLKPWADAIAALKAKSAGTPVAVTEPVGDYLLQAAGLRIATPFTLEASIMNGTDPAPQDVTAEEDLLTQRKVKLFVYNQQVTDPLTQTFLGLAKQNHIPIVGVYETMPQGFTYQGWMLAETQALARAAQTGLSTETLGH
ncbi:MAG: zinc ABC transporter substrate-binding protein [Acidocella sp.]|nr:zinc ABC transporter substrate-binding protein [Acidocella sp.]